MNRKKLTRALILSTTIFASFCLISQAKAGAELTKDELKEYNANNISFYLPCGGGNTLSGEITISGKTAGEKLWSGLKSFLSDEQAAGIMGNIGEEDGNYNPVRREIGQSGGLYDRSVQMGLGFIQWSFGRRVNLLEFIKSQDSSLLKYFEDDSYAQITGDDFISQVGENNANKIFQLEIQFLKNEIDKSYKEYYNETDIDNATVWFRANVERAGVYSDENRKKHAHEAYSKYAGKTIEGSSSNSSLPACTGEGSRNIAQAAFELAWPEGTSSSKYAYPEGSATDKFTTALDKFYPEHSKWGAAPSVGASCDVFVGTVVRYAGIDSKYPRGLDGVWNDIVNKGGTDIWEVIKWDGKNWKDTLRNGDILIYSKGDGGHTYVFAQKDGEYYILEAGFERVYGHVEKVNKNKDTIKGSEYASHGLYILRAKNGISGTTNQFSGTISNTAQGNHDINATAISFAWPKGTDPKKWDLNESCNASGTEAFANYYNSVVPESTRNKANCKTHTDTYLLGASCSVFVGTVLKYSGLLPNTGSGGLSNFMVSELLTILTSDEGKKAGWEEVNDKNNLRPGDVIINPDQHTEIYVEIGGKGYIAVANHGGNSATAHHQFAHIKDFEKSAVSGSKRVFRNKNNTTANSACDMCAGNDNSMGLKKGGFTLEEAQSFMQPYIKEAGKMKHGSGTYLGAYVNDAECAYGTLNNCVAFSQWFLNKYTALGGSNHKGAPTNNGKGMVGSLKERGLKTGTEPRPYAIFSEPGPSEYGHTGVVLGVADDYIIIGEAACSLGPSQGWPRVSKVSLSDTKSRGFTYAYTDDILIGI